MNDSPVNDNEPFFHRRLLALVGQELSSVVFVMDYWQLTFHHYGFSILSTMTVEGDGWVVRPGDNDFRNRLCECIMHSVVQAYEENNAVRIVFDNGYKFELSFRAEDYKGPEALHFDAPNEPMIII